MIPKGATGLLYRPGAVSVDRNGDAIDADGHVVRNESPGTFIGELKGILVGGPSASTALSRGDYSDTTGKFGVPLENDIRVKYNDRIVIGDETYKVTSRGDWAFPNSMSGTRPRYAWYSVEDTAGARNSV